MSNRDHKPATLCETVAKPQTEKLPSEQSDENTVTINPNDPQQWAGKLKSLGGSDSDDWNNVICNQAVRTNWTAHSDADEKIKLATATVSGMRGIGPRDEIEGMIAAQMIAGHNAAMECYRRAMVEGQTFEGRKENLNQATKLTRATAALTEALNRHRGKGQQKVTVEHVHVHSGGQAIVGSVENKGGRSANESKD